MTATPPTLTDEDRQAIAAILANGKTLPCGGRTWEGPFNRAAPIYRMVDPSAIPNQVSARRLVQALKHEEEHGVLEWPTKNYYAEHWECIDHVVTNRNKAATAPEAPADYVQLRLPQHPLATRNGLVLEHRAVLHDLLGDGPQACRWCQREVRWDAPLFDEAELTVDHLDRDRANNDPANLVPACRPCNSAKLTATPASPEPHSEAHEPHSHIEAPQPVKSSDQGTASREPREPREPSDRTGSGLTRCFDVSERSLSWLQGSRRARVAVILAGLFMAGMFGSAWVVASPAAFLPGVQKGRGTEAPAEATTTVPRAPLEGPPVTEWPPPTTAAPTTTQWTLPEPCTPSHCPSLDN